MTDTNVTHTLAAARYVEYIHEIGKELNYATGWRSSAAQRVGVSLSLLSQILKGRKVTRTTIEKAIAAAKLPSDYFGDIESISTMTRTMPPPPMDTVRPPDLSAGTVLAVDPLLVLEAFNALPTDTQRRLLGLMTA